MMDVRQKVIGDSTRKCDITKKAYAAGADQGKLSGRDCI